MSEKKYTIGGIFLSNVKRYKWMAMFVIIGYFLVYSIDISFPWMYKVFFDLLDTQGPPSVAIPGLIKVILIITALYAIRLIVRSSADFVNNRIQPKIMNDLAADSFSRLLIHSYRFFTNNFAGALVRKIQRLSFAFESVADTFLFNIINLAVSFAGAIIILSWRSPVLGAIVAVWCATITVLAYFFTKFTQKYRKERASADSETTGAFSDTITNAMNVKQMAGYAHEKELISSVLEKLRRLRTLTWDFHVLAGVIHTVLLASLELGTLYYAAGLWEQGRLTIGDFALLQGIILQLWSITWSIQHVFRSLSESWADAQEMVDILNMPYEIDDAKGAKPLSVSSGRIIFDRVGFNYNETRTVLKSLSMQIKPGEKIALVGSSGAGKSTIVKLLFRFYDLTGGKILIDGQNIAKVTQDSLRDAMSMVPQDPLLFHRSLMDNIRYGRRDATDEDVYAAAKKAHCHEFISALPDGYNTFVGERGIKLSGGERQRVAIARAILKNAPILVLDEATSSLDSESEALIHEALHELMMNKTVIVIAHRLSTIMEMDRIVVIDEGRIVDQGTHAELLKKRGGIYKKLWSIQAGGFLS